MATVGTDKVGAETKAAIIQKKKNDKKEKDNGAKERKKGKGSKKANDASEQELDDLLETVLRGL